MAGSWDPDRRARRIVYALAAVGVCLIAWGGAAGSLWAVGVGVWLLIVAIMTDLVRFP
ncbi:MULTISPECIES: hypothetical protein [unclassified Streptomyces]|uniref:hypothetical protein n=1 Tax=unclassified Streptomyces TaxID=2593676 RepID=UPI00344B363A